MSRGSGTTVLKYLFWSPGLHWLSQCLSSLHFDYFIIWFEAYVHMRDKAGMHIHVHIRREHRTVGLKRERATRELREDVLGVFTYIYTCNQMDTHNREMRIRGLIPDELLL